MIAIGNAALGHILTSQDIEYQRISFLFDSIQCDTVRFDLRPFLTMALVAVVGVVGAGHHLLVELEASYKWIKYAQLSNHLTQNVPMVLLAIINDKLLPLSGHNDQ